MSKRFIWTIELENKLKEMYPTMTSQKIAEYFNVNVGTIKNAVYRLGLKKDKEWIRENSRYNSQFNKGFNRNKIKKGTIPPNKGKKQSEYMSNKAIEKSKKTQFKKGNIPHNSFKDWQEILRPEKNGKYYWRIKVPGKPKIIYKNIWLWELHNGKIPKNHVIVFKDGNTENCVIENLECISRSELMLRNALHNYPPELKETIRLKNKISKKLKTINK